MREPVADSRFGEKTGAHDRSGRSIAVKPQGYGVLRVRFESILGEVQELGGCYNGRKGSKINHLW